MPDQYDGRPVARILICEDEFLVAEDFALTLRDLGYETAGIVATGEEAVRKAKEVRPDLILMDINLAGEIDGIEAVEQIRAQFDVPVIYLTAYTEEDVLERAKQTEPYGYVGKPVGLLQLRCTVETALYKHQADRRVRESEERFRKVFEQGPIGMGLVGTDGRFLVVNSQLCQMLGYTEDELTRFTFVDITHPDRVTQDLEAVRRLCAGEIPYYKAEKRYIKKDGSILWGDLTAAAIRDAEGKLLYLLPMIQDINDRKRSEEALRESERKFRETVTYLDEGYYSCTLDGILLEHNRAFNQILGLEISRDLTGTSLPDFWRSPNDRSEYVNELMGKGVIRNYQINAKRATGERLVVMANAHLVKDENKRPVRIQGTFTDITDLKKAEEALRESENQSSKVIESISDGFFALDANLVVTYFNKAAEQLLGRNSEEVIGKRLFDAFPHAKGSIFDEKYGQALREKTQMHFETYFGIDPYKNWYEVRVYPFEEGISVYFQVTTERKKAEEAARDAATKYRSLVELVPAVTYIATLDEASTTTYISPQIETVLGFSPAEYQDDCDLWRKQLHPEDRDRVIAEVTRCHSTGEAFLQEYRMISKDGGIVWLSDEAAIVRDQDGKPIYLQGIMLDVTDRKKAEDTLRAKEKLLDQIYEILPVGLWIADKNGELLRSNPAGRQIWGAEPLVGQEGYGVFKARRLPSGEEIAPSDWALARTVKEGVSVLEELLEIDAFDGETRIILNYTAPVLDDGGNVDAAVIVNLDVTERMRAEEALRESEERFRLAMEATSDGVWDWNLNTNDVFRSPRFFSMLGYQEQDFSGRFGEWQNLVHPEDLETVLHALKEYLNGERQAYEVEFRMFAKSGDLVWILSRGRVTDRDNDGKPLRMIGTHTDITDRKRAEEALQESEGRYRAIFNNAAVGINLSDPQGKFVHVNSKSENLLGYNEEELQGLTIFDLTHPEDREASRGQLLKLQHGEKNAYRLAKRYIRKDGQTIWADLSVSALRDVNGEYSSTLAVVVDITEQKKAEQLLQQAESRYRGLFEHAPSMYVITRSEQGVPLISDCNNLFLSTVGHSREEVLGQPLANFYSPGSCSALLEGGGYPRALAGEFFIGERQLLKRDGTLVPTMLYTAPEVDASGEVIGTCAMFVDITEQKRAEEALRDSESFLNSVIDQSPYPMWIADHQGTLIRMNKALGDLLHISKEEVVGKYNVLRDNLVQDQGFLPLVKRVFEEGDIVRFELKYDSSQLKHIQLRRSTFVILDVTIFPIKDSGGKITNAVIQHMDITERKQAEEALQDSEQRYRGVVENAAIGIDVVDAEGRFLQVNKSLAQMLGYSEGELLKLTIFDVSHPDDVEVSRVNHQTMVHGETDSYRFEKRYQRKDGEVMWADVSVSPVRGTDGGHLSTIGVIADITDRKKAEEALRSEREQLVSIFESINEVILVIDPRSFEILYANKFTEDLYGKTLRGGHCYERLNNLASPCEHCDIDKVMALKGKPYQWEYHNHVLNKDFLATDKIISWSDGHDVKFQIAVDITRRKLEEQEKENLRSQLFQAQKMEAIGTLAGGIAHDFNNLLQVTMGYSELLLQEKSENDPDYADLGKILHAARSGSELVRNLLAFSRKSEPKPVPMDLNSEVVHVEKLLQRTIPKMIEIRLDLAVGLERINADPAQIEQIIMNLAVNARDAMGEEGSLTLRTENVTLDEECCRLNVEAKPGDYVLLSVSDTGHGMDKDTLQHIFEPFYTTKELGRGTGLGLAMVYGIVKQHGGHIDCYSVVGKGTTFKIYFPAIPSVDVTDVEESVIVPAFGTETVLMVDDEDHVRGLGERILKKSGYTVLSAANGEEALAVYSQQKEQISLVILDLIMPSMGGRDCLQELITIDPTVKVLIASGYAADETTRECIRLGAKGFVAKPYRLKELLKQVRKALDQG